ncbi:MAG: peptidoglycan recognition family protein [Prosthecobacter sp.]|nr:peptidoglycan recognition family protein [Prosthecobacter sp.]
MPATPRIYTTVEWKARTITTTFKRSPAKGIVIHNTENANRAPATGAAEEKVAFAVARGIQKHHIDDNGWSDTGQHFTVSRGGLIMEGRTGALSAAGKGEVVSGAHASGVTKFNTTYFGIELEGDNRKEYAVTAQQWDALVELCAWLCRAGGITPNKTGIVGHMDVLAGHTDCPGKMQQKLPDLRQQVAANLAKPPSPDAAAPAPGPASKKPAVIATVKDSSENTVKVYQLPDETAFFYLSVMSVDADGSPRAYHPGDYPVDHHIGLDNPAHAGKPGNWWALATDNDKPTGNPLVQKAADPAPGYWISMTALSSGPSTKPGSYVNADVIPYFVMPAKLAGAKKGDFGIVYNKQNGKYTGAIFADTNPAVGEASMACAEALGISKDARHGGTSQKIVGYLVFPKSGDGKPKPLAEVLNKAETRFADWGGAGKLAKLLDQIA